MTQNNFEVVIDANIQAIVRRLQEVGERAEEMGRRAGESIRNMEEGFSNFGGKAKAVGGELAGLTAPLVAFGAGAMLSAKSFDDAMLLIQNRTNATGEELVQLEDAAKQAFESGVTDSIGTAAQAVATLHSTLGETISPMDEITTKSLALSSQFEIGTDEMARAVKSLTDNFEGLSEVQALDMIAQGFKDGLTN